MGVRPEWYYKSRAFGASVVVSLVLGLAFVLLLHEGLRGWLDFEGEVHFESFRWVFAAVFGVFALIVSFMCASIFTKIITKDKDATNAVITAFIGTFILAFVAYAVTVLLGHSFGDVFTLRVIWALAWRFAVVGLLQIIVAFVVIKKLGGGRSQDYEDED